MKSNKVFNETVIANALVAILERLESLERATNVLAGRHLAEIKHQPSKTLPSVEQAVLVQKLEKLTLKRHAVLTATLGGLGYAEIAKLMECDVTTVKLHLKATLNILGLRNRSTMLARSSAMLDFIHDTDYQVRYGISKRWWLEDDPELMAVLRPQKAANNQHVRSS